jgi:hypothetical protein
MVDILESSALTEKCMPAPLSPQNSISLLHMDITLIAECQSGKETPIPKFNILQFVKN